jgi:hypothetical protein
MQELKFLPDHFCLHTTFGGRLFYTTGQDDGNIFCADLIHDRSSSVGEGNFINELDDYYEFQRLALKFGKPVRCKVPQHVIYDCLRNATNRTGGVCLVKDLYDPNKRILKVDRYVISLTHFVHTDAFIVTQEALHEVVSYLLRED